MTEHNFKQKKRLLWEFPADKVSHFYAYHLLTVCWQTKFVYSSPQLLWRNHHIPFFFTLFKGYTYNKLSVITPKTISYWSQRKYISNFTEIEKTQVKSSCVGFHFFILWNLKLLNYVFSGPHKDLFFGVINRPFPSSPGLCFKMRVGAQPLIWKSFFILMQIKLIFTRKVVHLALFWKWGFLELGSSLFIALEKCEKKMPYAWNYSGTRFYPLKIEIAQFPNGFHFNSLRNRWAI